MLKKSTREILLQDLLEIKQLLIDTFDDKEIPLIKGGAIDQFYTGKALEFQRNIILFDTLMGSGVMEDKDANDSKESHLEKIAVDLAEIKSKLIG
ncbi:hypothetical protein [Chryseobacterium sp. CFBP8996]|uniref:hypothetical protein n=1 Tax=Chryseobacterium sp. CFBP8996 TaxID=3096529 RepID=UPI002A6B56BB|nr:hypothetical protein [Chryseobacterium sp. CFBP8996]MDY0931103.1 hypothetical protein [Chryseobacterium sp. CFBP8996]